MNWYHLNMKNEQKKRAIFVTDWDWRSWTNTWVGLNGWSKWFSIFDLRLHTGRGIMHTMRAGYRFSWKLDDIFISILSKIACFEDFKFQLELKYIYIYMFYIKEYKGLSQANTCAEVRDPDHCIFKWPRLFTPRTFDSEDCFKDAQDTLDRYQRTRNTGLNWTHLNFNELIWILMKKWIAIN